MENTPMRARLVDAILLLSVFLTCCVSQTRAQEQAPDLSGLWIMEAELGAPNIPNVKMVQDGTKVKSVFVDVDPGNKWGWVIGDPDLDVTIDGRSIRGKINTHYPVIPFKTNCPDIWAYWTDVELTISADGNKLEGRWKKRTSDDKTCKLQSEEWLPLSYIRPAPEITEEADRIRVSLPGGILFDFDKYNLKPDAQRVLGQVLSGVIDKHPGSKLVVEGHTDSVGTDQHNQDLSVNRAQSVASWLKQHGVEASRISVVGWGKTQPHYPNDTEEHRYRNRRVEISVLTGKA
jgi:outer membrane protein OmpA-like peptidoglycan-associated protein